MSHRPGDDVLFLTCQRFRSTVQSAEWAGDGLNDAQRRQAPISRMVPERATLVDLFRRGARRTRLAAATFTAMSTAFYPGYLFVRSNANVPDAHPDAQQ